jgi:hypothetical protein
MLLRLQRRALSLAFRGSGSKVWLVVGTAAWLIRTANRLRHKESEIVYVEALQPGERLVIDHLPAPGKRRRG